MKPVIIFIVLIAMNFVGNIVAERLLPTFADDSFMRRVGYRFVFVGVFLASLVLLLPLATLADYLEK